MAVQEALMKELYIIIQKCIQQHSENDYMTMSQTSKRMKSSQFFTGLDKATYCHLTARTQKVLIYFIYT